MPHPYDELTPELLSRRRSEKWRHFPPDVLPVWVAEMDFPLAEPIADVLRALVDAGDTGYGHPGRLPESYAAFASDRYGVEMDPGRITLVPDVMRGVLAMIELFTSPGDGVLITTPVYPPFFSTIPYAGRRVVEAPLTQASPGAPFEVDLDAVEHGLAIDGATALLLCNPHNPTGRVLSRADLEAIGEIAQRHGARVISDEVHAPLTYPGHQHVPFASLASSAARRSITLVSGSKAWNLPGLKCAMAITPDREVWREVDGLPLEVKEPGLFGVAANEVAFREGGPWLEDTLAYLDGNRAVLAGFLHDLLRAVTHHAPEATYLAWLDCRALGLGPDPSTAFLERGRVAVNPGPAFGAPGEGWVRLNFATSRANIHEAVRRMAVATADSGSG